MKKRYRHSWRLFRRVRLPEVKAPGCGRESPRPLAACQGHPRCNQLGDRRAAVAAALKVSRQSVSRWYQDWLNKDAKAIQGASRAGRKRRLSKQQVAQIQKELLKGALAHGYSSDLWTLPRVARVIENTAAVRYHPGHVWRILRQMGWSLQRPSLRAKERDEQKIRLGKRRTWAKVKKTPKSGGPG
jgi:transposase